jgi:hypothetical protein
MISIKCAEAPILAEALNRGLSNLYRTKRLVDEYDYTKNDDLLRLSIVFIHATLEDVMRNLIFYKMQGLEN